MSRTEVHRPVKHLPGYKEYSDEWDYWTSGWVHPDTVNDKIGEVTAFIRFESRKGSNPYRDEYRVVSAPRRIDMDVSTLEGATLHGILNEVFDNPEGIVVNPRFTKDRVTRRNVLSEVRFGLDMSLPRAVFGRNMKLVTKQVETDIVKDRADYYGNQYWTAIVTFSLSIVNTTRQEASKERRDEFHGAGGYEALPDFFQSGSRNHAIDKHFGHWSGDTDERRVENRQSRHRANGRLNDIARSVNGGFDPEDFNEPID